MSSAPHDGTITVVTRFQCALSLLGVTVLALIASCTTTTSGSAVAPVIERRGPTGPVPPGLEKFYGQALSWDDCESYAKTDLDGSVMKDDEVRCTRLTVPLDYAKPDGDTITIGVLRRAAGDSQRRIGSLII